MTTDLVKGFKDFSGDEAEKREAIRKILVETFEKYGFEPAETPIIEYEDFVRGENKEDEAVSDIFKLQDKGKRNLALRYEFTFQLKRLMKNKKLPYKRYQIGEVFRDEPVQGNRVRQFTSADADIIGSGIKDEAEVLATVKGILDKLMIKNYTIYINNIKLLNEILDEAGIKEKDRKQVIREIDKLDKISEEEVKKNLKKFKAEKVINILKNREKFFSKFSSYKEIEELKKYCGYYKVKVEFLSTLARGLSYYDGNVFEVKSDIKETIFGGGAYTFNKIPSFGYGTSIERLSIIAKIKTEKENFLVISLNQDREAIKLAQKLRKEGEMVSLYYGKPSKALDYANSYGFQKAIFVGNKEVKEKKFKIKDMKTGKESLFGADKWLTSKKIKEIRDHYN